MTEAEQPKPTELGEEGEPIAPDAPAEPTEPVDLTGPDAVLAEPVGEGLSEGEGEDEPEFGPEAVPEGGVDPENGPDDEPETVIEPEPQGEAVSEPKPDHDDQAEADDDVDAVADDDVDAVADDEANSEADAVANSVADAEVAPDPDVVPLQDPDPMPEQEQSRPAQAAAPQGRSVWYMLFHTVRGLVLLALIPVIFLLLAPILLIGQEITAPTWLKTRVEAQAARVLNGGQISFGTITVEVARDLHPVVRMTQTEMRDADGVILARVPIMEIAVSPRGVVFLQEVLPQRITLTGAQIALRRSADGTVAIAFEQSAAPAGSADSLAEFIDLIEQTFDAPVLAALESVRAEGLIINYEDLRAGRAWTVDGGTLALDVTEEATALSGDFALLAGRDFVTEIGLTLTSDRQSLAAEIAVEVTDALAPDIASQSPALSWLGLLDARLSARFNGSLGPTGELGELRARLDIAAGALQPTREASPVAFDGARAVLAYDPASARIRFEDVSVISEWGRVAAEGHAYLREVANGWPEALIGQFTLTNIVLDPPDIYPEPLRLDTAGMDFRLRLDPFALEVGSFHVIDVPAVELASAEPAPDIVLANAASGTRLDGHARVSANSEGWQVALDAGIDRIEVDRLLALWPVSIKPGTRLWFANNVSRGIMTDVSAGMRVAPGQDAPVWALTQVFSDADVRVQRDLPILRGASGMAVIQDNVLTVMLNEGRMPAPQGGEVALAGSVFQIPDTRIHQPPATLHLEARSTITAALTLLDLPPFSFLSKAGRTVEMAQGQARASADMSLRLRPRQPGDEVLFSAVADLTEVRSDVLVPGRILTASALRLSIDNDGMEVGGPMRLGQVAADVTFRTALGPGRAPGATISGQIEISERFIDEFDIGLPAGMVTGAGRGQLELALSDGPPRFSVTSNLNGIRLRIPSLGWTKAAGTTGRFAIAGLLGDVPRVERVALEAAGLDVIGSVTLRPTGGLDRAEFSRVRLGGWLNSPATLVGRGAGRAPEVQVSGGSLDLRSAAFGDGGGEGGPMTVALERLQVTEGIALTGFRGTFSGAGGFNGNFTGRVNGGAQVRGTVAPGGGGTAVRIVSDDAGGVISSAGLLPNGVGGALDMALTPVGVEGSYDGRARITDLRVRDAPELAQLLDAISVVGLLQQMDGQGLSFTEVDATFRILPGQIAVSQASAVGPGLGISLDGTYTQASSQMDFRGVISPLYLLNGVGAVLTRPGEGLFGFNYTLRGPVSGPSVQVNPLSILTPGMFREIFRAPPPG